MTAFISNGKMRLDEIVSTQQKEYSQSSTENKTKFGSDLLNYERDVEQLKKTLEDRFNAMYDGYTDKVEAFKLEADTQIETASADYICKISEIKEMIDLVKYSAFTHSYKTEADKSQKSAIVWHRLAVIFMAAASVFALLMLIIFINEDTSGVQVIARMFTTVTFASIATYMG
jgi:tRNA A37 N6-isopentenylltransferase MiaA